MVKYWKFYWKESLTDIKRNWVVLICIAFSISMFSGLAYFNDANQKMNFHESLRFMSDFEIIHDQTYSVDFGWTTRVDFAENFKETDEKIFGICNSSGLDIAQIFKYGMMRMEEAIVVSSSWESIDHNQFHDGFEYRKELNASEINIGMFSDKFYQSERFVTYFKTIEGETPSNPDEIMIDISYATKYNLNIGETTNITIVIGMTMNMYPLIVNFHEIRIENQTITGIYVPNQKEYYIDKNYFQYSYDFTDYLNNKTYEIPEDHIENPMIFSYNDFSDEQSANILKKLNDDILNTPEISKYERAYRTFSGYLLNYERTNIEFQNLQTMRRLITSESYELYLDLPMEVGYIDRLSLNLGEIMSEFSEKRIIIQFLNLPIIIFSILINKNLKKQDNEVINNKIFKLRGKGMPKKIIITQQLIFILINGIFASIIGLLFGGLTFYGYGSTLGNLYPSSNSLAQFPVITDLTIILSFILGIFISILSNVDRIQKIKKSNYSQLSNSLTVTDQEKIDITLTSSHKEKFESRKKFPFLLMIKIVIGLIPIGLYALLYVNEVSRLPDSLVDITLTLLDNVEFLLFSAFIGLGLLVSSFVRILAVENTKKYQRYSQIFSQLFIKELNPIVAQNLISNKKWSKILSYLSLFIAYVVSMNVFFYTQLNIEILVSNFQVGTNILSYFHDPSIADLQGDFSLEFGKSGFFKMLYIDFLIIGIFLAIELAMNVIIIAQENHYLTQNLINRGIPKRKLLQMLITQTSIIFSVASIIGIGSGLLFGVGINKITSFLLIRSSAIIFPSEMSYPIFFEFWSVLGLIAAIFVTVCTVLVINYVGKYRDRVKLESSSEGLMAQSD